MRWAKVDDTTWPIDDDDNDESVQWIMRYGTDYERKRVSLAAASVMAAYAALIDPTIPQTDAVAKLKRARRAAADR